MAWSVAGNVSLGDHPLGLKAHEQLTRGTVAPPELFPSLGAHVARADRGGESHQLVRLIAQRDAPTDVHEGVRCPLLVNDETGITCGVPSAVMVASFAVRVP
jgi:hypothetical protein